MRFFKIEEFKCKCCGRVMMNTEFIDRLDRARAIADIPFVINSGYRCQKHNREVGSKETSSHLRGLAADIRCTDSTARFRILSALLSAGFFRIGIGSDFIHVDNDPEKSGWVAWLY